MSRRESRNSLGTRQNDALFEFENFKKRFLMANKQITKLNSTLSTRIEELNMQISTLYTENLRLRASEIALSSQLKREREKSQKIMVEVETATLGLTKHFQFLRHSMGISDEQEPSPASPTAPRARRPIPNPDPNATPNLNRLSRVPTVPGIHEDDESSTEPPSPQRKSSSKTGSSATSTVKSKGRLSASKLPLPSRTLSPPPLPTPHSIVPLPMQIEIDVGTSRKKQSRRHIDLLTIPSDHERPPSPAFGSPVGKAAALEDDTEAEMEVATEAAPLGRVISRKEAMKAKQQTREPLTIVTANLNKLEKKRRREDSDGSESSSSTAQRNKGRLKDVTNSPIGIAPEEDSPPELPQNSVAPPKREYLTPPLSSEHPPGNTQLLTPRVSSSPPPSNDLDEASGIGGRERRTRKSVNYAEPKLNTKMRKPDGHSSNANSSKRKRASTSTAPLTNKEKEGTGSRIETLLPLHVSGSTQGKHKDYNSDDDDGTSSDSSDGGDADSEYIPGGTLSRFVNVESRRKVSRKDDRRIDTSDLDSLGGRRHSTVM